VVSTVSCNFFSELDLVVVFGGDFRHMDDLGWEFSGVFVKFIFFLSLGNEGCSPLFANFEVNLGRKGFLSCSGMF